MINIIQEIIPNITQEHIDNDIELDIISGYGGMKIGTCNVSDVLSIVEHEDKLINRDYTIVIPQ